MPLTCTRPASIRARSSLVRYPNAKIVLTVRDDPVKWWHSTRRTLYKPSDRWLPFISRLLSPEAQQQKLFMWERQLLWDGIYQGRFLEDGVAVKVCVVRPLCHRVFCVGTRGGCCWVGTVAAHSPTHHYITHLTTTPHILPASLPASLVLPDRLVCLKKKVREPHSRGAGVRPQSGTRSAGVQHEAGLEAALRLPGRASSPPALPTEECARHALAHRVLAPLRVG